MLEYKMRFSEFEDILFSEYFDKDYNCSEDPFDTLTFSPDNTEGWEDRYLPNGRFLAQGWRMERLFEKIPVFLKFYREGSRDEPVPFDIEWELDFLAGRTCPVRMPGTKVAGMSFYTIVPKERLPFNEVEVMRISSFAEKFFNNSKLFKSAHFCVESGKHENKPNLHIHALILFKKGQGKNFSRSLKSCWNAVYEQKYNISYKEKGNIGIHRVPCNTEQIQLDKESYMSNAHKGSHENFTDLGINKQFVF